MYGSLLIKNDVLDRWKKYLAELRGSNDNTKASETKYQAQDLLDQRMVRIFRKKISIVESVAETVFS